MARTTSARRSSAGRKGGKSASSERSYQNYRDTLLEWSERPAVRYVAGGIGIALLARFAMAAGDRPAAVPRRGRIVVALLEQHAAGRVDQNDGRTFGKLGHGAPLRGEYRVASTEYRARTRPGEVIAPLSTFMIAPVK